VRIALTRPTPPGFATLDTGKRNYVNLKSVPVEFGALAVALLLFVRVAATIAGPLGALGGVAWTGVYMSAFLLIVFAIDRLGAEHDRHEQTRAVDHADEPPVERLAS
jgi:hypothetical protein